MSAGAIDSEAIVNAFASHAMKLGEFERHLKHEPKGTPGQGLTVAFWWESLRPIPLASGLSETSILLELTCRMYKPMLSAPEDAIDPLIMRAVDALFTAVSADFTLGGLIRNVDLLGAHSTGFSARAGYQTINQTMFRVMTIVTPCVVSNAFTQEA